MQAYLKFGLTLLVNGVIMYLVMYLMINTWADFYLNINRLYMTILMVAPMAVLMLLTMPMMFENKKLNYMLIGGAAMLFIIALAAVRWQAAVGDSQFLRSMIPHHSSAIVMCREADISDPEIRTLCDKIVQTQQEEIDQMNRIYARQP